MKKYIVPTTDIQSILIKAIICHSTDGAGVAERPVNPSTSGKGGPLGAPMRWL